MSSPNPSIFPASLLSSDAAAALPTGFTIRPLEKADYAKGFLECLRDLTWMDNVTEEDFNERYDDMDTGGKGPYYYLVIEHEGKIVGTGAVIVEKKLSVFSPISHAHVVQIGVHSFVDKFGRQKYTKSHHGRPH